MSDINYVDTETEEELIAEGRKWLLIAGIVLAAVNAAVFLSAFVPHSVTDMIAAAGSSVGTVCGVILAAGTRHCRKVMAADLVLSALPVAAVLIIRFIGMFGGYSAELTGLMQILKAVWEFLKTFAVHILAIAAYGFAQVLAFVNIYEIKAVRSYICSKNA